MKAIKLFSVLAALCIGQTVFAQNKAVTDLTTAYYGLKNALVADDGKTAADHAKDFLKSIDAVSKSELTADQLKVWDEHKNDLTVTGEIIAKNKSVEKQREQLNTLSVSLFETLKAMDINEDPVYYQYCPMKKAYWLSEEKQVKNPYYGKMMLTCGSVKETLE